MDKTKYIVNDIITADSKNLCEHVEPESVALTITSPPYRNAINYSMHVKNTTENTNNKFRGNVGSSTSDYLDEMEKIFSQVYKATISGGICCIVIGDEVDTGKLIPLPSLIISRLVGESFDKNRWKLRDMIIWNKVTAGRNGAGNRFGIFIQNPLPNYYRSNIMHEYIIVLEKGEHRRIIDKSKTKKIPLNRSMKRQVALSMWDTVEKQIIKESEKNTWDITPVPPKSIKHPAVFPEQIPWRLITLYSKEGDVVLDPMNGSGQTTKVAYQLKRKYVGIDKRSAYVKLAKQRLNEPLALSNFMIPFYLSKSWSKKEESGKKINAELDISDVPKGFKFIFSKESPRQVLGISGNYFYYKDKTSNWLCFIFAKSENPTRINIGKFKNPEDPLRIVFNAIQKIVKELKITAFNKLQLSEKLPQNLIENNQPIKAVIDVLEYDGYLHIKKRYKGRELYELVSKNN